MSTALLPTTIQVGPFRFTVIANGQAIANVRKNSQQGSRIGETMFTDLTITLDPDLPPVLLAEALLHEVLHCCWWTCGLPDEQLTHESGVRALSPILLDTLRRNPLLVAYLCENEK